MKKITIITGHYGSGKTTIAINLALYLKKQNKKVTVIDLDIINPFFRTSEYSNILHQNDINTILPIYANTTSDMPSISPDINAMFSNNDIYYILDIGGDDIGATVLGQFASRLKISGYDMLFVINKFRFMSNTIQKSINIFHEIQMSSKLEISGIVDNSNLGISTTSDLINSSKYFAHQLSNQLNLPLIYIKKNKILNQLGA